MDRNRNLFRQEYTDFLGTLGSFCAFRTNNEVRQSTNSARISICELVFYAIRAKDKFSIIDENVRRSSRTFSVRQECSVFQEEHRIR